MDYLESSLSLPLNPFLAPLTTLSSRDLESYFKRFLRHHISKAKALLLFSGGLDSTVLFHLLGRYLAPSQFSVLHVNYHLRKESDSDQDFVRDLCVKNQVAYKIKSVPLKKKSNGNLQGLARTIRYRLARETMESEGITYLFTGHHYDDAIENFFLKQLKGQSVSSVQDLFHPQKSYHLKPLVFFSKEAILHYAESNRISHVEDRSNQELFYQRNFLRNHTFPAWNKQFPHWRKNTHLFHQSIIEQTKLLTQLIPKTQLVLNHPPFFLLSNDFFSLDPSSKNWLLHFFLSRNYSEERFTHHAILNYVEKLHQGQKGGILFNSKKHGPIFYSHRLIGPSLITTDRLTDWKTTQPHHLSYRFGSNYLLTLTRHSNLSTEQALVGYCHSPSHLSSIRGYQLTSSHSHELYDRSQKRLLKKSLSDHKIPIPGRKNGWILEGSCGKQKIILGFLSGLFHLKKSFYANHDIKFFIPNDQHKNSNLIYYLILEGPSNEKL